MIFRFKQFTILDRQVAMKIGTDSVILGSWAKPWQAKSALDIGSGSGIIAMMLVQRFPFLEFDAIEIDPEAYIDLQQNLSQPFFEHKIKPLLGDFNTYKFSCKYDLVISNPPFFEGSDSLELPRKVARHQSKLTINQLINKATSLMNAAASLIIVFPYAQRFELVVEAFKNNLFLCDELLVKDTYDAQYKRCVLHFSNAKPFVVNREILTLKEKGGGITKQFKQLTNDFHLD
jgi:tRNA1Val (adenine37-N6)-methyltransferase